MKYYALADENGSVDLGTVADNESLPGGAVALTEQQFDTATAINNRHRRKIVGGAVVARTEQEWEAQITAVRLDKEVRKASLRVLRTDMRTLGDDRPVGDFTYNGAKFLPTRYVRELVHNAVVAELAGHSVLPLAINDVDLNVVTITTAAGLKAFHAAMTGHVKTVVESGQALRRDLVAAGSMGDVNAARANNTARKDGKTERDGALGAGGR